MKNHIAFLVLSVLLLACKHGHMQDHHHGSANEFMHRSSIEDLIANFEKPERDAYQEPEKVISFIGPVDGLKIMDLGAGSGYFTFRLSRAGAQVIAADVNEEFQEHIKNKINEYDLDSLGIELRKIPYDSPKLGDGEVDKVLLVNTYHHIEDRVAYFEKVKKGLSENGELVVIDYFKKDIPVGPPKGHKISREVVLNELESAGFDDIREYTDILKYQYIIRAR